MPLEFIRAGYKFFFNILVVPQKLPHKNHCQLNIHKHKPRVIHTTLYNIKLSSLDSFGCGRVTGCSRTTAYHKVSA